MSINKSYLFVLLLTILFTSCNSNCPTTTMAAYHSCSKLYSMLEAALLENQLNLFQLHDVLFPSNSAEPPYAEVYYNISNVNESQSYLFSCWTSSVVLKSVEPAVLITLQLQLLNQVLETVGASKLTELGVSMHFILKVNFTESDYDEHTMDVVLQGLTSWLKVYASTQRSRSSWNTADFKYKGYSCPYNATLTNMLYVIVVLTVTLTIITLVAAAPKFYRKVASHIERGSQWYSFFWATSFIALVCSIALLLYELMNIVGPFLWYRYVKVVVMCLAILLDTLVVICIPKSAEFPIPSIAYLFSFPLGCCCSKQLQSKWIQAVAMISILSFAQFVAVGVVPTILWAFVYPVQTISVISLFTATIFCVIAFLALLLRNNRQFMCRERCSLQNNWSSVQLLLILVVLLFLAIVILSSYVYIKFITSAMEINQIGGFIASFLPSAVLTIVGWFVTKDKFITEGYSTRSQHRVDPPTEQTPLHTSTSSR